MGEPNGQNAGLNTPDITLNVNMETAAASGWETVPTPRFGNAETSVDVNTKLEVSAGQILRVIGDNIDVIGNMLARYLRLAFENSSLESIK